MCGAEVPFSSGARARCLFCSHELDIPNSLLVPIEKNSVLDNAVTEAAKALRRVSPVGESLRKFIFSGVGAIMLPNIAAFVMIFSSSPDSGNRLMALVMMSGLSLLVPIVVLIQHQKNRRLLRQRFSRIRPVRFRLDTTLHFLCPGCGAELLSQPNAITVSCDHCRAESLLPSFAIDSLLRKKYERIANLLRKRDESKNEVEDSDLTFPLSMILIGVVCMVGILAASPADKLYMGLAGVYGTSGLVSWGALLLVGHSADLMRLYGAAILLFGVATGIMLVLLFPDADLTAVMVFDFLFCICVGLAMMISGFVKKRAKGR